MKSNVRKNLIETARVVLVARWSLVMLWIRRMLLEPTRRVRTLATSAKLKRLMLIVAAKRAQMLSRIRRIRLRLVRRVWIPAILAFAVVVAIASSVAFWDWLRGYVNGVPPMDLESPSTTVRNLALGVAGLLALAVALWRGYVANRQAETAEQQLLNDRYQKASEMLGSEIMTVRLGGIHQLRRLAIERAEQFHVPVLQSLCAFICEPPLPVGDPSVDGRGPFSHIPADIRAALEAIQDRDLPDRRAIEIKARYRPDLQGVRLPGANLILMNLSGAELNDADLSGAALNGCSLVECSMWNIDLSNSELEDAILCNSDFFLAVLDGADFTEADLAGANVTGASFSAEGQNPARGLTQLQIGTAMAERGSEPDLEGVLDAETGAPLVWNGFTLT